MENLDLRVQDAIGPVVRGVRTGPKAHVQLAPAVAVFQCLPLSEAIELLRSRAATGGQMDTVELHDSVQKGECVHRAAGLDERIGCSRQGDSYRRVSQAPRSTGAGQVTNDPGLLPILSQ